MSLCNGVNGPDNCNIVLNNVEWSVGSYNNKQNPRIWLLKVQ